MDTIDANDLKLMVDILEDIHDDEITISSPAPHPWATTTHSSSILANIQTIGISKNYECQPLRPPQPRLSNSTVPVPIPPKVKPRKEPTKKRKRQSKNTAAPNKQPPGEKKQKQTHHLADTMRKMYEYLTEHGEVNLTDTKFREALGNPDVRRIYDALRWLEGFGFVEREQFPIEGKTIAYLIFEDGSTLKSLRDELKQAEGD